jgi:nitrogen fixation protein NifU and related proteins
MQNDYYGRITDPSAVGILTGPCGDTMAFYLVIKNRIITRVQYLTDGCQHTRVCGRVVARHAQGTPITIALGISPRQVLHELPRLPKENRHCALLAVSAFYSAVGQYWISQAGVQ